MDTTKHTTTVPLQDYNEMMQAYEKQKELAKALFQHFGILKQAGIFIDVERMKLTPPKNVIASNRPEGTRILFEY